MRSSQPSQMRRKRLGPSEKQGHVCACACACACACVCVCEMELSASTPKTWAWAIGLATHFLDCMPFSLCLSHALQAARSFHEQHFEHLKHEWETVDKAQIRKILGVELVSTGTACVCVRVCVFGRGEMRVRPFCSWFTLPASSFLHSCVCVCLALQTGRDVGITDAKGLCAGAQVVGFFFRG